MVRRRATPYAVHDVVFETVREHGRCRKSGALIVIEENPSLRSGDASWRWWVNVPIFTDKNLSLARGGGTGEAKTRKAARKAARKALAESLRKHPQRDREMEG